MKPTPIAALAALRLASMSAAHEWSAAQLAPRTPWSASEIEAALSIARGWGCCQRADGTKNYTITAAGVARVEKAKNADDNRKRAKRMRDKAREVVQPKRNGVADIDDGLDIHVARRYEVLTAIAERPDCTIWDASVATGTDPGSSRHSGGARAVIAALGSLGLIRLDARDEPTANGRIRPVYHLHATAAGLAALASKGGRA